MERVVRQSPAVAEFDSVMKKMQWCCETSSVLIVSACNPSYWISWCSRTLSSTVFLTSTVGCPMPMISVLLRIGRALG